MKIGEKGRERERERPERGWRRGLLLVEVHHLVAAVKVQVVVMKRDLGN